jgi:hypothetical protein
MTPYTRKEQVCYNWVMVQGGCHQVAKQFPVTVTATEWLFGHDCYLRPSSFIGILVAGLGSVCHYLLTSSYL